MAIEPHRVNHSVVAAVDVGECSTERGGGEGAPLILSEKVSHSVVVGVEGEAASSRGATV
jgi:hypothetical protein